MHLLWDQKAYQKCEVGGEKLLVYDAREDYRNIKQKECKHVELATAGAAPRAPAAPGAHGPASPRPPRPTAARRGEPGELVWSGRERGPHTGTGAHGLVLLPACPPRAGFRVAAPCPSRCCLPGAGGCCDGHFFVFPFMEQKLQCNIRFLASRFIESINIVKNRRFW